MTPFWDKAVADWVDMRLEHAGPFPHDTCQAMGVEHKGATVAGFVFHNYDPDAGVIEVSGASDHPRWATKTVVREAMDYVFRVAGCQMLYARQHIDNIAARRGWLHLGATEHIIPRLFGRGTTGTLLFLTAEQWASSSIAKAS
jgi:RimJ/RimL family protein N-acetyltransferase